jgi:superfamily II DNA or RNA helicase
MGTGLGKSFILQLIAKHYGLQTVIMAPSTSIARQLFKEIEHHFGKKRVGLYGDGKKDFKKLITVAIGASLTRIEQDSPAWNALSTAQVFIADESHQTPAATLQKVCFGLLENAPYRFFFSGTQMRNDGLDLVLEAITGPIVYRMTVKEGVDQNYLAKPLFTMFKVKSDEEYWNKDSNAMTRAHLFYNPNVLKLAAEIANKSVRLANRPVLILVEEMEQFTKLLPMLEFECRFAHGGVTKENAAKIPKDYHDSDPNAFVQEFNEGKVKILIGTSCVATGTDIQAAKHIIYLRGGASPIELRQSVGRGTRLVEGKKDCYFSDFCISTKYDGDSAEEGALSRHALTRATIMNDIYGPVRWVDLQ